MAELFEKLDLWSQGLFYSSWLTPWLSLTPEGRQEKAHESKNP
jgi:hypothetical protein